MNKDTIRLTGMQFYGYHGCLAEEQKNGQVFLIDVSLETDLSAAGETDQLEKTINYAAVYEDIKAIAEGDPVRLIERLAHLIAEKILASYVVEAVTVTVHKPHAPIPGLFADAAVEIRRSRR